MKVDEDRFGVAEVARVEGRPIHVVRSKADAAKTLLVLAGIHGDEPGGLLAVPSILAAWDSASVRLVMVTPVNPVGAAKGTRVNGTGHDINRDFIRFATPEARAVRDEYDRVRPDFVISLHEGPQRGAFMFLNRHVIGAAALADALAAGGTVLATRDYFGRRLRTPGVAPVSPMTRVVWRAGALIGKMATITYSENRGVPEIVLEGSTRIEDEAARARPHVDLVAAVARVLK
jgi:predicted deacylase